MTMSLFFQLIQVALGHRTVLDYAPSDVEWRLLFDMAVRQSLLGICACGVESLPSEQRPPRDVAMRLAVLVSSIEQRNKWLTDKCGEITELLAYDGFDTCILKGQGIASLYPNPLRRQSGDIDILCFKQNRDHTDYCNISLMDAVVGYVRSHTMQAGKVVYHHADMYVAFGRSGDGNVLYLSPAHGDAIEIEMHYRPSWFYSPLRNWRFQRWYDCHRYDMEKSPDGQFLMPTAEFNAVYILVHIYRHLFDEGVGLRQLLDYYYVLQRLADIDGDMGMVCSTLQQLGMKRFCRAVMFVLREVFGMADCYMPFPADEREGSFLLDEIMLAGNFGRYDERSRPKDGESLIARFVRRQRRVARFLAHYPEETVCAPQWTVWQWTWRRMNGY